MAFKVWLYDVATGNEKAGQVDLASTNMVTGLLPATNMNVDGTSLDGSGATLSVKALGITAAKLSTGSGSDWQQLVYDSSGSVLAWTTNTSTVQPCRVAATANITIAAPGAAIDGLTLNTNDRVLLTGQSTPSQNGCYVFNGSATPMTRTVDTNAGTRLASGTIVQVWAGTVGANSIWILSTDSAITIGSTSLTFTKITGFTGTVTSVSVVTANGVSGSVATATTTPAITITLGAITPTSVTMGGTAQAVGGITPILQNLGTTQTGASALQAQYTNDANGALLQFLKSRGTSIGSNVVDASGDIIGELDFYGVNSSPALAVASKIKVITDGSPGASFVPSRIEFHTGTNAAAPVLAGMFANGGQFVLGNNPFASALSFQSLTPAFQVLGATNSTASGTFQQYSANATGPTIGFAKSRATSIGATGVATSSHDVIGKLDFQAINTGLGAANVAYMQVVQDSSAGATFVPGSFEFWTATTTAAPSLKFQIQSDGNVNIGANGNPANNSRLYIFGGTNGANVDIRGDSAVSDQATVELEGSDYDTNFNSIRLQQYGVTNSLGTTLGYTNTNLQGLLFQGVDTVTAMIAAMGNFDLHFGSNFKEWMILSKLGDFGIHTTAPTANFQVNQQTYGPGTVSNSASSGAVTGVGTQFTNTFKIGDSITIGVETKTISAIGSDTTMTTGTFTSAHSNLSYTLTGGTRFQVFGNGAFGGTGTFTAGNFSGTHSGTSSGTNTGDQTITLTSDVTGTGTGSFATTIAAGAVTLAKMANLAANSFIGNNTGSPATPIALSVAQSLALLGVSSGASVSSVAMTVPSFLSVAGSPITSSGTLAVTLATQAQNLIFSGPASGSAATPTFRALAALDMGTGTANNTVFHRGDLTWTNQLAGDFFISNATSTILIGGTSKQTLNSIVPTLQVLGITNAAATSLNGQYSANATGPTYQFLKSRGASIGTIAATSSADVIGKLDFWAANANGTSAMANAAFVQAVVDGSPGTTFVPGRIEWYTGTSAAAPAVNMMLNNTGVLLLGGSGTTLDTNAASKLQLVNTTAAANNRALFSQYTADAIGSILHFHKSRGTTINSTGVLSAGDVLGQFTFSSAMSLTGFLETAYLKVTAPSAWVNNASTGKSSTQFEFWTNDGATGDFGTPTASAIIANGGQVTGGSVSSFGLNATPLLGTLPSTNARLCNVAGTLGSTTGISISDYASAGGSGNIVFQKSRGGAYPTITSGTLVSGDVIGLIDYWGVNNNGTKAMVQAGFNQVVTDGTPGASFVPSRFEWYTGTNAAAPALHMTLNNAGVLVLGGTATAQTVNSLTAQFQTLYLTPNAASNLNAYYANDAVGPVYQYLKSRGTAVGTLTALSSADIISEQQFIGVNSGNAAAVAASYLVKVDGAPGASFVPGRHEWNTGTAAAASTLSMTLDATKRLTVAGRVDVGDHVYIRQGALTGFGTTSTGAYIGWNLSGGSAEAAYVNSFTAAGGGHWFYKSDNTTNTLMRAFNADFSDWYISKGTTAPATPAAGRLATYAQAIANKPMLAQLNPNGTNNALQPFLGRAKVQLWTPRGDATTNVDTFGFPTLTSIGTVTARTVATTNYITRLQRLGFVTTSAAAGLLVGHNASNATITGGTGTAGDGSGFLYVCRFVPTDPATVAGARMFVGLSSNVATPTNVDPSTLTNCIGVGQQASDTTQLYIFSGGSAAQAPIALGATNFPGQTLSTAAYEIAIYSPNSSANTFYVQVCRLDTGVYSAVTTLTGAATIIPQSTTLLSHRAWRCNNATALSSALDIELVYIEPNTNN